MSFKSLENNQVSISGEITSGFNFDHESFGEKFYIVMVKIQRISESFDILPVMVSNRLVDVSEDRTGKFVSVKGQFRSYNKHENGHNKLVLCVFALDFSFLDVDCVINNDNFILLDGFICKKPIYRQTPLGREITDILLAVNRPYGKSDYIPCICWGRNSRYVGNLNVGERCAIEGRIQSRDYIKRFADGSEESRTAYEVSITKFEVYEEE